ncbi:MAG TPA: gamma-glutamyl-phosphate reductase, partial [Oscillospiraceae bacterium]|nr:gamma-glutamyl-phosphate reductase [Oscillospiraceae bacterium]
MSYISELGKRSKTAERTLVAASTALKNHALSLIADELINNSDAIIAANNLDLEAAVKNNMSVAMQDRLKLTAERIGGIASAVRELI